MFICVTMRYRELGPGTAPGLAGTSKRLDEARQIVAEYIADLREIFRRLRKLN
jgi:hypothetical protein